MNGEAEGERSSPPTERGLAPPPQRRARYVPQRRVERWIVPLLAEAIAQRLQRFAAPLAPGRSLDVGCGGQPFRAELERLGFAYTGFDLGQNADRSVDVLGSIEEPLPEVLLARAPFAFILCSEVLEHVPRWPEAFANLARLLRPGGRLLVTTPHLWVPHEEPSDYYRPTSGALDFHARRAGLVTLDLARLGDGYDVLGTVLATTRPRVPSGRWWFAPLLLPFDLARRLALVVLRATALRGAVALETSLYLSSVGVFEKPR
jgi:SAM-dependent methyltransferase